MTNSPVKGVHLRLKDTESTDNLVRYIKEGLAPIGVNFMVLEFNPGYKFECFPELSEGTFGKEDAKKVGAAAKEAGIKIAPLIMCLGHQGWGSSPNKLLEVYPEFKETPDVKIGKKEPDKIAGKFINNTPHGEFYCHSWCASNDGVYKYVLPMIDEITTDLGTDMVHVGLDEVFSIAEDSCPNCTGKGKAELFARTVNILHDYIVKKQGWQMLMWGDRLNNAKECGYSDWDGDGLGMWRAIDMIPKDIVICDWHYDIIESGFPSVGVFMEKGFTVIPAAWRSLKQTKVFWDDAVKQVSDKNLGKLAGMMVTCWAEASAEYLDKLNTHVKAGLQDEENDDDRGIASSVVYMAKTVK